MLPIEEVFKRFGKKLKPQKRANITKIETLLKTVPDKIVIISVILAQESNHDCREFHEHARTPILSFQSKIANSWLLPYDLVYFRDSQGEVLPGEYPVYCLGSQVVLEAGLMVFNGETTAITLLTKDQIVACQVYSK